MSRGLGGALSIAALVTIADALVMLYAFDPKRAGSPSILVAMFALYAVLAVLAVLRLSRDKSLRRELRPAFGDLSFGAISAGVLYGGAVLAKTALMPHGSARESWIMMVYNQIGDPLDVRQTVAFGIFVIAVLEELVWRGLVMRALEEPLGDRKALLLTTALYAGAHLPTLWSLRTGAGPNPLIVLAAAGCGLAWGAIAQRTKRLVPALVAHGVFTWAVVEFPVWRP